jgi:prevent-host-death family protein
MRLTATEFRQNLYHILDEVLEKGIPIEIERKGEILKIVPEKPVGKLEKLELHQTIVGDPESIVNIDWSGYWKE